MAEDNGALGNQNGGTDVAPAKKKLSGKVIVLFIVLPIVLLIGIGTVTYFLVFANKGNADTEQAQTDKKDKATDAKKDEKKEGKKGEASAEGASGDAAGGDNADANGVKTSAGPNGETFLTLPDIIVNITSSENRATYLKLRLSLQVKDADTAAAIEPLYPVLKDRYTGFLRELRMEDIQGSAGYSRLQYELLKRTNMAVAPAQVDAVLIEEMLVN